jgi:hypothetical protein
MTFRELINEVLLRLREDTITLDWSGNINDSLTVTPYQKVVASLVNDSKRGVEIYHDWLVLRETVSVATVSGTDTYNLNSGQEIKVIDVINQDTGIRLSQVSREVMNTLKYPTNSTGEPRYYAFNGADSNNNLKIQVEPVPVDAQTLSFDIIKYQDTLKTAASVIKVPQQPVLLGAWSRAISERGEDGGTQMTITAKETLESLNQAILVDSGNTQYESDWYVR